MEDNLPMGRPSFESSFPFDEIRPEQRQAIDLALDTFLRTGKKFVILDCPPFAKIV
jgi:sulfate adenylyltransferase subunit 1 (EFTu-like GTPase family)